VYWDNRDFFANPSRGFSFRTKIARDFGWFDSSGSWTNVDAELDVYFPLGSTETFRQRILAFDVWTAYSPSWEVQPDGAIENRAPAYAGATLGGLWRMRGYPSQRFSDKAAVYYGLECRLTPEWNPFPKWPWLQQHVGVQWVQFVPFFELGRVSPSWNIRELHEDMKWSLGLGFRAWAKGIVARIDAAASDEEFKLQMMVSQPFQF
jgi:outer membrane protein assembly factor BamA